MLLASIFKKAVHRKIVSSSCKRGVVAGTGGCSGDHVLYKYIRIYCMRTHTYMYMLLACCLGCVPVFDTSNMEEVKCGFDGCEVNGPGLESCWPIPVPEEDPDFAYNRCMKFVRSAEVPPLSCDYSKYLLTVCNYSNYGPCHVITVSAVMVMPVK